MARLAPRRTRTLAGRGFTVVELAVSLAIAVVAMVMLLPVVGEARRTALESSCLANQMTLGMGFQSYVDAYAQLPGMNWQEGVYWSKPWGYGSYYGGVQSWMAHSPGNPHEFVGALHWGTPTVSSYSGIGYVYPFVGGDGRNFYCPGTTASFDHNPAPSGPTDEGGTNGEGWYSTWTGIDTAFADYEFGVDGKGTLTTYYYRGGMYERDTSLDDQDAAWGGGQNWTTGVLSRPTDPWVQNKPTLTCYWLGGWYEGWNQPGEPDYSTIPHGGRDVNLLYTDGSARTWSLPEDMNPVWGWFDAGAYTAAHYDADNFYKQMPFFWVRAQRDE